MNEQTYNTISILEQPDTTDLVVIIPEKEPEQEQEQEEPEQEKETETALYLAFSR
jgi:N-acetylglutamate synthase/N-acetylornithine aminotransferase